MGSYSLSLTMSFMFIIMIIYTTSKSTNNEMHGQLDEIEVYTHKINCLYVEMTDISDESLFFVRYFLFFLYRKLLKIAKNFVRVQEKDIICVISEHYSHVYDNSKDYGEKKMKKLIRQLKRHKGDK